MFAVAAVILFIVGIFVLGTVHSWAFWLLLGCAVLALHFVFDVGIPTLTARASGRRVVQ